MVKYLAGNVVEVNDEEDRESNLNQFPTNLRLYNKRKILTVNGAKKTADFTDDFTGTDDWSDTGTRVVVDTAGDTIDYDITTTVNDDATHIDRTSINDTFVLDWDWVISSQTTNTNGTAQEIWAVISSANGATAIDANQDALAVALSTQASSNKIRVAYGDGDSLRTHITDFFNGALEANVTYYMRMTKENEKLIATVYYDSDRTEVRATQSITVPTTVTGLQYIKFQNWNDTGVNGNITGTINKVELYDGVTTVENIPSQQTAEAVWGTSADQTIEDCTTYTDQTDFDNSWVTTQTTKMRGNPTNDNIDCTTLGSDGNLKSTIYYDLGSALSDTNWVLRYKLDLTTITLASGSWLQTSIVLSSGTGTIDSAHDYVGTNFLVSASDKDFRRVWADNTASLDGNNGTIIDQINAGVYYIEQTRKDNVLTTNVYSDSNYETLTYTDTDIISNITGLRYFKVMDSELVTSGEVTFTLDDLQVWNNISEVNPTTISDFVLPVKFQGDTDLQRKIAETIDDDFTSDNFNDNNTNIEVDTALEQLTMTIDRGGNDATTLDLTTPLSDSSWVVDFDLTMDTISGSDASEEIFGIYMSDSPYTTAHTALQKGIGLLYDYSNTQNHFHTMETNDDAGGFGSHGTGIAQFSLVPITDKKYFMRIQRNSTTDFCIKIFADSARSVLIEEQHSVCPAGITGLRYFKVSNYDTSTSTNTISAHLNNLKIWDGITNPVEQETPTFEDDMTSYQDQTEFNNTWIPEVNASTSRGNPTDNDIDNRFGSGGGTTNESVIKDLGYVLDDNQWVMRFRLNASTVSRPANETSGGNIGIFSADGASSISAGTGGTAQDGISLGIVNQSTESQFRCANAKNNVNHYRVGTQFTDQINVETFYVEIARLNKTTMRITLFSDANYSIVNESQEDVIDGTITGLRYVGFKNIIQNGTSNSCVIQWTDIEIWNGTSTPNAQARKFSFMDNTNTTEYSSETVSYDPINGDYLGNVRIPSLTTGTDFNVNMYYDYRGTDYSPEYRTNIGFNGEGFYDDISTDNWNTEGTATTVNTTLQQIEVITDSSGAQNGRESQRIKIPDTSIDNDDGFVLRAEVEVRDTLSQGVDADAQEFYFSISNAQTDATGTVNELAFRFIVTSSTIGIEAVDNQAGSQLNSVTGTAFTDNMVAQKYYCEIRRTSSTNVDFSLYTDADYSDLIETVSETVSASIDNLKFVKIITRTDGVADHTLDADVRNIQFWNFAGKPNRENTTYDEDYVAVYHLQGNSVDSSGNGNDGTDTSVDWEQQNNSVGLVADGADTDINLGSDASVDDVMDNGGEFDVWINPKSDGESNLGEIVAKVPGWQLRSGTESGNFIPLTILVDFSTTDGIWVTTNAIIPLNELTKLTLKINNDSVDNDPILIVNGVKYTVGNGLTENQTPVGTRVSEASQTLYLADDGGGAQTWDGFISDPKISDKTRPSAQAIATYNAEKSGSDMLTVSATETQRYEKNQTGIKVKQRIDNKEFNLVNDEFVEVV